MSDTPRTDARVKQMIDNDQGPEGLEYWARQLERELNSAEAAIKQQELLVEENLRLKEKIRSLEVERDAMMADLLLWRGEK